jgi:hypothetical protein
VSDTTSVESASECHVEGGHKATLSTSFHATVHCLSGCAIGECAGLVIGVSLGLPPLQIIILATGLAYLSGFALGAYPVMKRESIGFVAAIKIIWIGEVVSIGVMEVAMNATDYYMGGMTVDSIFSAVFLIAMGAALVAGFVAAWPVNYWLLNRNLKNCH